jgi:hypothetical protein
MRRFIFSITLILAGTLFASDSYAGCSCQCANGLMRGVCSSVFETPPICSQSPCPIGPMSTVPNLAPLIGLRATSCSQVKQCDQFANCEWKQICR